MRRFAKRLFIFLFIAFVVATGLAIATRTGLLSGSGSQFSAALDWLAENAPIIIALNALLGIGGWLSQ